MNNSDVLNNFLGNEYKIFLGETEFEKLVNIFNTWSIENNENLELQIVEIDSIISVCASYSNYIEISYSKKCEDYIAYRQFIIFLHEKNELLRNKNKEKYIRSFDLQDKFHSHKMEIITELYELLTQKNNTLSKQYISKDTEFINFIIALSNFQLPHPLKIKWVSKDKSNQNTNKNDILRIFKTILIDELKLIKVNEEMFDSQIKRIFVDYKGNELDNWKQTKSSYLSKYPSGIVAKKNENIDLIDDFFKIKTSLKNILQNCKAK